MPRDLAALLGSLLLLSGCTPANLRPAVEASLRASRPTIRDDVPTLVRAGDLSGADQRLRALQARYEVDHLTEPDLFDALGVLEDTADPDLEPLYREWTEHFPDSFAAHLVAGVYYAERAWIARGSAWAEDTPPERFQAMKALLAIAARHLETARQLHPELVASHAYLIDVAKGLEDRARVERVKVEALRIAPDSGIVRLKYVASILPRWGGSLDAMRRFLTETEPYVRTNPTLGFLLGGVACEQGDEVGFIAKSPRWDEALAYYSEALSYGRYWFYLRSRADALVHLGRYDDAIADLEEAVRLRPANRELHVMLAHARSQRSK